MSAGDPIHTRRKARAGGGEWAVFVVLYLCLLALLGDFIANDKPLYCRIGGSTYLPVLRSYAVDLGLTTWPEALQGPDWHARPYERVIFPPVPFSAGALDMSTANFRKPMTATVLQSGKYRHVLGTDGLGRDVLAGLIRGTRISLFVGVFSMLLAACLGIPLGAVSGYFGDSRHTPQVHAVVIWCLAVILSAYYFVQAALDFMRSAAGHRFMIIGLAILLCAWGAVWLVERLGWRSREVRMPWDFVVLRSVEVVRSIPAFFLLFALLGIVRQASLLYVVVLIGLLRCPTIIRYVRAETMRLRDQTFIDSARVVGLSDARIIRRHIIPNALGPVFITMAFGVGLAILLESGLSFLGIGVSIDQVTWGRMLNTARNNFSAWWMAVFPGLAIFVTIAAFNRIGDKLTRKFQAQ